MFGFNYRVVPVNEAKNVYKLTPTTGTLLKCFAPSLVLGAVMGALYVAGVVIENNKSFAYTDPTETPDES